jgi:hypothetical protein
MLGGWAKSSFFFAPVLGPLAVDMAPYSHCKHSSIAALVQTSARLTKTTMSYAYSKNFLEDLLKKQEEDYYAGEYKIFRLKNHSVRYWPNLEEEDSAAIRDADTTSYLFTGD